MANGETPPRHAGRSPVDPAPVERDYIPIMPGGGATRRLKTSEIVAREIAQDIVTRRLQPGDSLPLEGAMTELYQVSRESLREGLRLLEVHGLIVIRRGPGGGPAVGTVDPANLGRISTLYYQLAGGTYRELFEAWEVSERLLAERAARNPDASLREARMKPFLDAIEAHGEVGEKDEYIDAQLHFHGAVASLLNNRVLELILQTPGQIVTHHVAVTTDPRTFREMVEHDHVGIANSVIAGKPSIAGNLMGEHIRQIGDLYQHRFGVDMDSLIIWN
jgi:GntR family transcriptional regulator, transcriptional repressor for pyruvate dehydrogenase complex